MSSLLVLGGVLVGASALVFLLLGCLPKPKPKPRRDPPELDFSHLDPKQRALMECAGSLLSFRLKHNITQPELAKRIGTSRSAVSRLEHGGNPTFDWLCRVADALGVELEIGVRGEK